MDEYNAPENAVQKIVTKLGGPTAVAELCGGITSQAVSNWIAENHIPQAREIYLRAVRADAFEGVAAKSADAAAEPAL